MSETFPKYFKNCTLSGHTQRRSECLHMRFDTWHVRCVTFSTHPGVKTRQPRFFLDFSDPSLAKSRKCGKSFGRHTPKTAIEYGGVVPRSQHPVALRTGNIVHKVPPLHIAPLSCRRQTRVRVHVYSPSEHRRRQLCIGGNCQVTSA